MTPAEPVLVPELQAASLVELATSRLRAEILGGALEPGERLVEEQLTRRFGISRGPLREALRQLAEQGLVEHLPRRGARVTTFSDRDFDELFAVRDALERFAITVLVDRPPQEPALARVRHTLADLDTAARTDDRLAASHAHRAFHVALVALADNRQLSMTYEPLIVKLQLYMAANLRREADLQSPVEGVRRHRALLDAILAGDPAQVSDQLEHHGARSYFR